MVNLKCEGDTKVIELTKEEHGAKICPICKKGFKTGQKAYICEICKKMYHYLCSMNIFIGIRESPGQCHHRMEYQYILGEVKVR